jgi:hypothetical protein
VQQAKEKNEQAGKEEEGAIADITSYIENEGKSVYNSEKEVNSPELTDGMIPIKWDSSKKDRTRSLGNNKQRRRRLV